jgi:hypothetical protein
LQQDLLFITQEPKKNMSARNGEVIRHTWKRAIPESLQTMEKLMAGKAMMKTLA